jgi:hypothetical protein
MYNITEEKVNDFHVLEINEGTFEGLKFTLGEIKFADEPNDDGTYSISFDYNVVNDYNVDKSLEEKLKTEIGDIVVSLITASIESADTLYKGGIDEQKS